MLGNLALVYQSKENYKPAQELRERVVRIDEKAFVTKCNNPEYQLPIGKQVVGIHPRYFRPTEVDLLIGDATKHLIDGGKRNRENEGAGSDITMITIFRFPFFSSRCACQTCLHCLPV